MRRILLLLGMLFMAGTVSAAPPREFSSAYPHVFVSPQITNPPIQFQNSGTPLGVSFTFNCSTGTSCSFVSGVMTITASGSGTIGSCGTTDALAYYSASTTTTCDAGITTNTSGQLSATGGFVSAADGVHAGYSTWVGNTANQAVVANTFGIMGPTAATFTAYALQFSGTGPTNATPLLSCATPASSVSACTFVATPSSISGLTTGFFPKASSATAIANSLCDEAITTANTITCTDTSGFAAVKYTSTGTTAGFLDLPQGSSSAAVAPCNAATSICEQAPTSVTSYLVVKPGVSANGIVTNNVAAAVDTQGFSGDANHSATITLSASQTVGATSLCSTTFCPAGTYMITIFTNITTACSTTGTFVPWVGWTDTTGAKGAVGTTFFGNGFGTGFTAATGTLTVTATTDYMEGTYIVHSTGAAAINYGYTTSACGSGSLVGTMYLNVVPLG